MVRLGREVTNQATVDRVEFYMTRESATTSDERDKAFTHLIERGLDAENVPDDPYNSTTTESDSD